MDDVSVRSLNQYIRMNLSNEFFHKKNINLTTVQEVQMKLNVIILAAVILEQ